MGAFPSNHLHDVVSHRELTALDVGRRAIQHALATGRLHRTYRGVYAVGRPDLTVWGQRRAILLACGPGAVLSHGSAAGAWGLRPDRNLGWDVIVPGARGPKAPVRIHRRRLGAHEQTTLQGIRITTVARRLFDLSSVIPMHQLRRAIQQSVAEDQFHLPDVRRILDAQRGRPGAPALEAVLADFKTHGMTRTRSDLEALFLQLCLDHGLPRPTINRPADGREIDATWPGHDLLVEIDSWTYHRSRIAFNTDRAKDRAALRAGRRTARFTGDDLEHHPAEAAAELFAVLDL